VISNQCVTKSVSVSNGTFTVSGRVTDAATGAGLAGIFVFADSDTDPFAGASSDSAGNYSFQVSPGPWRVRPNEGQPALQGYLGLRREVETNVTSHITNLDFQLPKATALIYGRVKDDQNQPLPGVGVGAEHAAGEYRASGRTFTTNADYAVAASAGSWGVGLERADQALRGYLVQNTNVTVSSGLAVRMDFVAQRATTKLG